MVHDGVGSGLNWAPGAQPPQTIRVGSARLAQSLEISVYSVAVGLAGIIALLSLVYAFLAFPQADDLERTAAMRWLTPLQRVTADYARIDGRWASLLVQYALYNTGHLLSWYPWMLMAPLVIGAVGCCCGISVITGACISQPSVLAGGLVAYAFLWVSAVRGESFYWFPSEMGYWLPIALGMVLLWVLCNGTGWRSHLVVLILSIIVPALHEVCGGWIVAVLGAICIVRVTQANPGRGIAALATIAGALSLASVVFAPAIRVRMHDTSQQSLAGALHRAVDIEAFLVSQWRVLLPVLVVILLLAMRSGGRPSWYVAAPRFIKICLAMAILPCPIILLTMISYGLGGGIPARVYDGVYFLLAIGVATFVAVCGFDLARCRLVTAIVDSPWGMLLRSALVALAVVETTHLPRFHPAFQDIKPAIQDHAIWDRRAREIAAQRDAGIRDVVVTERMIPLTILPTWFDITEDPDWYANQHMATYFGLHSIRLSALPSGQDAGGGK